MLTKRILACLDVDGGRVVKGTQFLNLRDAGDPAELAARHSAAGADELVLLDVAATYERRNTLLETVRRTAEELFIPFTVGGGVRTLRDAARIFDAGADKITINSAAISDPSLITSIAQRFGSQAVIVAIDAKRAGHDFEAWIAGGRVATGKNAVDWAKEAEAHGAGEILLTSMDRDGTRSGFDCELTNAVSSTVQIPVIASGGAGSAQHFVEVFQKGSADAALGASIFHCNPGSIFRAQAAPSGRRNRCEAAVLIPSIDLMNGKIVQLVQGKKKALEFADFEPWVARFSSFPLVQLIDLDAAMGQGANSVLIDMFLKQLPCQVGGGVRSLATAKTMIRAGARRVILGSALIKNAAVNVALAQQFAEEVGPDRLVFAIDARAGKVAVGGWKEITEISPLQMTKNLDSFCSAFLYTHIDTEGLMSGLPLGPVRELRSAATKQLIVAGGISTREEVEHLHGMGVDAVVGMALYTGGFELPYTMPVTR